MDSTSAAGRGRARGRGRGAPPAQLRRPGEGVAVGAGGAQAQVPGAQGNRAGEQSAGRGVVRERVTEDAVAGLVSGVRNLSAHGVGAAGGAEAAGSSAPPSGDGAVSVSGRGAMRGTRRLQPTLRTRPDHVLTKRGTGGTDLKITANYYKLLSRPDWCLRQYRVDFAPDEERTHVRKALLRQLSEKLGGYLFDGTMIFTVNSLVPPQMAEVMYVVTNDVDERINITLKPVGDGVAPGDLGYVQVFNLLVKRSLAALGLTQLNGDFYDPNAAINVRDRGLTLWPGYKTSIRQHEDAILLCVETTHKVLRNDTVHDMLRSFIARANFREMFSKEILGCVVITKYNRRTYQIHDVEYDVHPSSTFDYKGQETTYAAYIQSKYQVAVHDMNQPMLVSRARASEVRSGMNPYFYLIPELCLVTGLSDSMRNDFELMRSLAVHTRMSPSTRIDKLTRFNQSMLHNAQVQSLLQSWQMTLDSNLIQIPARIVQPESIILGGGKSVQVRESADWTQDLRSNPMLQAVELRDWVVVHPSTPDSFRKVPEFIGTLRKVAQGMKFQISEPSIVPVQQHMSSYVSALGSIMDNRNPQLILCVLQRNNGAIYSAIKKKCCIDRPVPTQVLLEKNLVGKGGMSIATKVAIQINCKLGGAPWTTHIPMDGLMMVGFDVCHDAVEKKKSFGAMVASLNRPMSRYFSAVSAHVEGEELSVELADNICRAVLKYQKFNGGAFPSKIIIYRDGVGEGQIPFVHSVEVAAIRQKLGIVYGNKEFQMAFIIVTKRINTRLFCGVRNPPPGTVVDDVVTDPLKYDFFLVSQSVRDGTVAPTHYNIIYDTIRWPPERMQRLTYKLCHLYFNWSGTVRVPAPCQYAHKLAFLVGQAIHRQPAAGLEDVLYFL